MQIKVTKSNYYTSTRITKILKTKNMPYISKNMGQMTLSYALAFIY